MSKDLEVTLESSTGRNLTFRDIKTGYTVSADTLINSLENGHSKYNKDYVVKERNGVKYVASKPDGSGSNNLG